MNNSAPKLEPLRVFVSYAFEDDAHRVQLEKHLKLLRREGLVETWTDRKILPGGRCSDEVPSEHHAAFDGRREAPSPVGVYPLGVSPEGAHDLTGSVDEWCADWYDIYPAEQQANPTGPDSGMGRVLRGGAFDFDAYALRAAYGTTASPRATASAWAFGWCGRRRENMTKLDPLWPGGARPWPSTRPPKTSRSASKNGGRLERSWTG